MITVQTLKTQDGYYGRVVAEGHTVMYTTPVYITQFMAMADANCWEKFHMTGTQEEPTTSEYTVDATDTVYYRSTKMTGTEFAEWIDKATARNADKVIQYGVESFRNGSQGFHLRVKIGTTPVRHFRVFKK